MMIFPKKGLNSETNCFLSSLRLVSSLRLLSLSLFEGLGSTSRAIRAGPSKAVLQIPGK